MNDQNITHNKNKLKNIKSEILEQKFEHELADVKKGELEAYKLTSGLHKVVIFAKAKSEYKLIKKVIFGIMGGIFIGLAYMAYITFIAMADDSDKTSLVLAKIAGVIIFPVGILAITFLGGNLFTSNCLISLSAHLKIIRKRDFLMDLIIVFASNLLGAIIFGFAIGLAGLFSEKFNIALIEIATDKLKSSAGNSIFVTSFFSAIFCNILVAGSIFAYTVLSDNKGLATFILYIMIVTFGVFGFQHIVANMALFASAGIASLFSGTPLGVEEQLPSLAIDYNGITSNGDFFFRVLLINFPIVTIGNFVGGIFISEVYFYAEAERLKKYKGINIIKKISNLRYDREISKPK